MEESQASVLDVAEYLLRKLGPMSAMKLEKLVYYCQAWSLVWDDRPLFREHIEAWTNGPVAPTLFQRHRGQFVVRAGDVGGNQDHLDAVGRETVDAVIAYYGHMNAQQLSDLTHGEAPWRETRKGMAADERGANEITLESMSEYYSSLPPDANFS